MRFVKFAALVAVVVVGSAQSAKATVYGSALLEFENMRVLYSSTGTAGSFVDATFAQVSVSFSQLETVVEGTLNGITDATSANFLGPFPVADTLQAFTTSGADVAPPQNTFTPTTPTGTGTAFARADSLTSGALIASAFPAPNDTGLTTSSISEIEAGDLSLGNSIGSSGGLATFTLNANQDGFYRIAFDGSYALEVNSIGPPSMREVSARSSLTIQLNYADVSSTNKYLTDDISGTGTSSGSFVNLMTETVELERGNVGILTVSSTTRVDVNAVPEPGSMLCFAALGLVGFVGRRRRS